MLFTPSRFARRFFSRVLWGAVLIVTGLQAQSELNLPEDTLPDLKRFIEIAADRSPRMILRSFDEAASDGELIAAKAARLPNLGMFGDILKAREDRADFAAPQSANKIYYRAQMTQPLFQWGIISRNIENAKLRREMEDGRTKQAFVTMAIEVRKKYLELILLKQMAVRHRFSMTLMEEELEQAIEKRELNTISEATLQDVRLKYKRNLAGTAYHEEQLLYTKGVFARMVGVESISDDEIADEFPKVTPESDARFLASLLARFSEDPGAWNSELNILELDLKTKRNDLQNSKVSLRPKFGLMAGISQDEQSYTANIAQRYEYQSIFGGLSVSWTLFDGFAKRGWVRAGLNRLRAGEKAFEMRRENIIADAESFARQLKYRAIEAEVGDQELVNAQNHFKYMQGQFDRGEASENDLAQAKLGMADRERSAMLARYVYWEALFNFLGIIEADPAVDLIPSHRL